MILFLLFCVDCKVPFGVRSGKIKDSHMTASSYGQSNQRAVYGRLDNDNCWCANSDSRAEYLQIDLGKVIRIIPASFDDDSNTRL